MMLAPAALCLLLFVVLSSSQSRGQFSKQQLNLSQAPAAAPLPPPRIGELLSKDGNHYLDARRTYAHVDKDNAKAGLFIAAAIGTFSLMFTLYCIYHKFYIRHQYLHTQLTDDPADPPTDPPPVCFRACAPRSTSDARRDGYGSLADSPSIISIPPSLSPPPSAMPFPPPYMSSHSLRTISAKDLEKNCI